MTEPKNCPKCNGVMSRGKILKTNQFTTRDEYIYLFAPDDEPEVGLFSKSPKVRKALVAFCCTQCGFVEFYGEGQFQ